MSNTAEAWAMHESDLSRYNGTKEVGSAFGDIDPGILARNTRYGLKALVNEFRILSQTTKLRGPQLNTSAYSLGQLVGSRNITSEDAWNCLWKASKENGLIDDPERGESYVRGTIKCGLEAGMKEPRYPAYDIEEAQAPEAETFQSVLGLICAADVKAEKVDWLWHGVLAKGKPTIIASDPGLGKSQLAIACAAIVSNGGSWPGSKVKVTPGNVVILSCEDGLADTIVPRLIAAGADLNKVFIMPAARDMKKDVPELAELIKGIGGCSLIIVDPISAYMAGLDINSSGDVRSITNELTSFAEEQGLCVLLIHHLNKNSDKKAAYRLIGSQSWQAAARVVYIIEKDGEDPDRRIMAPSKNNLAPDTTGYAYRIESVTLPGDIKTSKVVFEDGSHITTADETISDKAGGDALNEAVDLLKELLKNGRFDSRKANQIAASEGISEITWRRAKKKLGVHTVSDDGWKTTFLEYELKAN